MPTQQLMIVVHLANDSSFYLQESREKDIVSWKLFSPALMPSILCQLH